MFLAVLTLLARAVEFRIALLVERALTSEHVRYVLEEIDD